MDSNNNDRSFDTVTKKCMEYMDQKTAATPCSMAISIMQETDIPMHNFVHHYLVPAVLMTLVCRLQKTGRRQYEENMAEIEKRSKNVLPAFCGFYGACGAAIGTGIFMSVHTGTTPMSKETWGLCNGITVRTLKRMAEIGGPRCCKRNTLIALQEGAEYIFEQTGIDIGREEKVKCTFSKFNLECLKEDCPFYAEGEKNI